MEFGIRDLQELNKLLFAVIELTDGSGSAPSQGVQQLCSSLVLGARKHNHARLLQVGSFLGLVGIAKKRIALTPQGKKFLSNNSSGAYELTVAQKEFLVSEFILQGKLRSQAEFIFRLFGRDYKRGTWILDTVDRPIPITLSWIISLFYAIGVIEREQYTLLIANKYVAGVSLLVNSKIGPSPEELEAILGARRKLGAVGEAIALDFEKKRLRILGRIAESDLVTQISEIDTAAGYDIESFDGDAPAYDYDRFIEVKTSSDMRIRFIWTGNEYRIAAMLADRYWIYFCGGLDIKKPQVFDLVLIQNPIAKLDTLGFTIEAYDYLVQCESPIQGGVQTQFGPNLIATIL